MGQHLRYVTICGIPVQATSSLSRKKINKLVCDVIRSWNWEGRQLGRIDLIRDGQWVHVYSYEQPTIHIVPADITTKDFLVPPQCSTLICTRF